MIARRSNVSLEVLMLCVEVSYHVSLPGTSSCRKGSAHAVLLARKTHANQMQLIRFYILDHDPSPI